MRKSLLLTALCITGTMMLTSCEQIKDFFEEEDGGVVLRKWTSIMVWMPTLLLKAVFRILLPTE